MRRVPTGFVLIDAAALADGKFRRLARRLPDPDDFNSAVGAWLIALSAARRNGVPEIDVREETGSRWVDVLEEVGLLTPDGFPPRSFADWSPKAAVSQAGGIARASGAERDAKGHFLPVQQSSRLDTLESLGPAFPSPPLTSTPSIPESTNGVGGPGEGVFDPELVALDTYWQLSGKYPKGRAKAWIERLVAEYGGEEVARALAKVPRDSPTMIQDAESLLFRGRAESEIQEKRRKEREVQEAARHRASGRSSLAPALDPAEYDRLRQEAKG